MSILTVNAEKCLNCGLCSSICPSKALRASEDGPYIKHDDNCIACGHCVAICPQQALDNAKAPLEGQQPLLRFPVLDAQTAEQFLRSRRSIRNYKQQPVPRELLTQLLDVARCAPTASNSQGVSYVVIDDKQRLRDITAATMEWMEQQFQAGDPIARYYELYIRIYHKTKQDMVLRDAPALILAVTPQNFGYGRYNSCFSLAYAELYATALGLGSCWMGFIERCARHHYQPLLDLLELPEGMEVTGAIVVGYPQYRYQRLPNRECINITFVGKTT